MSISVLPAELLHLIFRELRGRDVAACRAVCGRWADALETAGERFWEQLCEKDYPDSYKEAYRKARLSWRELHASLSLWPEVSTANVTIYETTAQGAHKFETLQNNIITYPQQLDLNFNTSDTIVYYDLERLKEIHREYFDFKFYTYEENDNIIVLEVDRYMNNTIRVIPKANKKNFKDFHMLRVTYRPWELLENEVRYPGLDCELCCAIVVKEDNDVYISNYILEPSPRGIRCRQYLPRDPHFFKEYDIDTKLIYGNIYIIGTIDPPGTLDIFYPYCANGDLKKDGIKPDKTIDLRELVMINEKANINESVQKIDVVEMANGHKIVVLYCGRVFVIELTHSSDTSDVQIRRSVVEPLKPQHELGKKNNDSTKSNCVLV